MTQIFPEEGNLGLVLPTNLCKWTTDKVRQEGVTVVPGTTVAKVTLSEAGKVVATLSNGNEVRIRERSFCISSHEMSHYSLKRTMWWWQLVWYQTLNLLNQPDWNWIQSWVVTESMQSCKHAQMSGW